MTKTSGAMHVAKITNRRVDKSGQPREYVSHLLRRTYRDGSKVKHETLANLSPLPDAAIEAVRAALAGKTLVVAGEGLEVTGSRPHGHVAAVHAQAKALGLGALLGPAGRDRDIALALIIARVCRPGSKLATTRWWADTTLADDLGVADATTDEVYAAMDWLAGRQEAIETKLVRTHLTGAANPDRLALFDLSSSWVTGRCCPLAARGYSRDGKKGLPQIEYGLLTDPAGRPVAVRVLPGNTADPTAFSAIVQAVKDTFKLTDMVMVGDRGMITSARVRSFASWAGSAGSPPCAPPRSPPWPPTTARCRCPCSTRPTWPRSPTPTTPANAWSRAATPPWPPSAQGNAWHCWKPPTSSCQRSPPPPMPGALPGRARSGSGSGRSSAGTRWPSTTP